ncbi:MAG: sugar O-acetyltransferase [Bacteroidaceae bacterium]|nr:sugar O-acetyltransferase [Bacteroidaceae bacterium]
MTEYEKMRSEQLYDFSNPEIETSIMRAKKLCAKLQTMTIFDDDYRSVIEELIPGIPKSAVINPPFHCDHGTGIVLGEGVFMNHNCVMLDGGYIRIGRNTLIGPNCQFYTPNHPMNHVERREPKETAFPISIGEDTWIGGNVTICPGITIGNRCIIAAGSVVTKDIPDDSLAAGCPAVVKRKVSQE